MHAIIKDSESTVSGALLWAANFLLNSATPRLDAEVLLGHVCELSQTERVTRANDRLTPYQWQRFREIVEQRANGKPVAQLTGTKEFWSLALTVTPDTLIPRPETEHLVEQALSVIPNDKIWNIVDLGTGCGAIAIAIAKERPNCKLLATDNCTKALQVARVNAKKYHLENIEFRHSNWLQALHDCHFDMIVSNPPYIKQSDPHLIRGDVRFEPRVALVAGEDGMSAISKIIIDGPRHLLTSGYLMLEHGYDQADDTRILLQQYGYGQIEHHQDLAGHNRITVAQLAKQLTTSIGKSV